MLVGIRLDVSFERQTSRYGIAWQHTYADDIFYLAMWY